jgi:hypothetical protein
VRDHFKRSCFFSAPHVANLNATAASTSESTAAAATAEVNAAIDASFESDRRA